MVVGGDWGRLVQVERIYDYLLEARAVWGPRTVNGSYLVVRVFVRKMAFKLGVNSAGHLLGGESGLYVCLA